MTVEEFANSRIAIGEAVERFGPIHWLRTKGLFYRPLLLSDAYSLANSELPRTGFGGFQYIVQDKQQANSTMSFLILDQLQSYNLSGLEHNRRRLIKNSAKLFEIRPVKDLAEFQEQGFHAYSSFYQRTRYRYKSNRTKRSNFARWAQAILQCPKALVLGGYEKSAGLKSVSISYWVGTSLLYSTFFSDTPSLQKGVGELMFHVLRQIACRESDIQDIIVRRYQGGNGMDNYYLLRGAKLVRRPARLYLHPMTKWMLKSCFPSRYARLAQGNELAAEL